MHFERYTLISSKCELECLSKVNYSFKIYCSEKNKSYSTEDVRFILAIENNFGWCEWAYSIEFKRATSNRSWSFWRQNIMVSHHLLCAHLAHF